VELVTEILGSEPEAANRPGPVDQVPPLHWAALNGHTAVCQLLLDSGAAINQLGGDHWSAALHWAACRGQVGTMTLLVRRGADFMSLRDQQGYLPIHIAAQHGQTFALLYLLAAARTGHVDVPDLHGRSPLIWAAYRGHDEAIQVLLDEGAQPAIKDKSGSSALHWASAKGCAQVIRLLLAAGADPHDPDGEGKSSIDHAREKRWPWFDALLKDFGVSSGTKSTTDLESGELVASTGERRWLPERLFRPLLDERSLKLVLGRVVPPITFLTCFYVACYAFNFVIGIALAIAISGGCQGLYMLLLPKSRHNDPKVPVLNSVHYTINAALAAIAILVFAPLQTSSIFFIGLLLMNIGVASVLLYKAQANDPGRVGKPKSDEERHKVNYVRGFLI